MSSKRSKNGGSSKSGGKAVGAGRSKRAKVTAKAASGVGTRKKASPTRGGRSGTSSPTHKKTAATSPKRKASPSRRKRGSSGGRSRRVKSGSARRSFALWLVGRGVYWSAVAALWACFVVGAVVSYYALTMPDPHLVGVSKKTPNIKILGSDGTVIADQGGRWSHVYIEDLPPFVVDAVLETEDRRFYSHFGVDVVGLGRAFIANWRAGRVVQGGSTITQQLAKNLFLDPRRTLGRKLREISMAIWLERAMTKDEILELYLNRVYFGAGAHGIGEASRLYFGKRAEKLSLGEAATLAGLLKAPSRYALTHNLKGAKARASVVLEKMVASGRVSRARAEAAMKKPLRITNAARYARGYDYAVDWVRDRLPKFAGNIGQDIVVRTTIDPRLQVHMQRIVGDVMAGAQEMVSAGQAAAVVLGHDGAVRAIAGGRSYRHSQFNRAVDAKRQPGSAFKPFVYLAAVERGFKPASVVTDAPIKVGNWRPGNSTGDFQGAMTLRTSMAKSVNTVSVRLLLNAGLVKVIETARRLGVQSRLRKDASLALGTSEVSLLELTSAYAPFANGGKLAAPFVIKSVKTAEGKLLYRRRAPARRRVMSLGSAAYMTDMLRAVVGWGTGKAAQIRGLDVAGKTGTSQGFRDAWFVGYTPKLVGGVWIGNDDGGAMHAVSGGGLPAKIWRKIMVAAHHKHGPIARQQRPRRDVPQRQTAMRGGRDLSIEQLLLREVRR